MGTAVEEDKPPAPPEQLLTAAATDAPAAGSEWNYEGVAVAGELAGERLVRLSIWPGFWFEWAAFHPETLVYDDGQN